MFFASAGVTELKAIVGLLRDQGFTRTKNAVRSKLSDVRRKKELGTNNGDWDINEVDIYIDHLNLEQTEDTFLRPRVGDLKFLDQVC